MARTTLGRRVGSMGAIGRCGTAPIVIGTRLRCARVSVVFTGFMSSRAAPIGVVVRGYEMTSDPLGMRPTRQERRRLAREATKPRRRPPVEFLFWDDEETVHAIPFPHGSVPDPADKALCGERVSEDAQGGDDTEESFDAEEYATCQTCLRLWRASGLAPVIKVEGKSS
jgi:hypothetical protein